MKAPRTVSLTVNGEALSGEASPRMLFADFLRDVLARPVRMLAVSTGFVEPVQSSSMMWRCGPV